MEKHLDAFKREAKSLALDLVDIVSDGASEDRHDEPTPVYERASADRAFGLHWALPLPAQISAPIGRFDLAQALRQAGAVLPADRLALQGLDTLSALLSQLRDRLLRHPALRSLDDFHLYGVLLKTLNKWFYNCNLRFVSFFGGGGCGCRSCHSSSEPVSSLIMEYVQVLQLTVLRLYNDVVQRSDAWTKDDGAALLRARTVSQELLQCCAYCLGDKFGDAQHCDRWFCQDAPQSIASSSSGATETESPQTKDKRALRRYIEQDLGGVAQMRARVALLECKSIEVGVALLEQLDQAATTPGDTNDQLGERVVFVHRRLAPLMLHASAQYTALEQQEKQRRARVKLTKRRGRLQSYARFMALYWQARADLLLAECEAQCYEARDFAERVPMGKSALRRLDELRTQFRETKALPRLDQELGERYDAMQERCDKLHKRLHAAVAQSYNYSADEAQLWPVSEYQEPAKRSGDAERTDYNSFTKELLRAYVEQQPDEQRDSLKNTLALLEQLYKQDRSATVLQQSAATTTGALSAERQNGTLEERLRWFQKLVALADAGGNRVVLEPAECDALRREMTKVEARVRGKK